MFRKYQPVFLILILSATTLHAQGMQDPETYERDRTSNGLNTVVDGSLPLVVNNLDWGKVLKGNILDYGCGAGSSGYRHIFPKVLQTDSILYSVDISEKMVAHAKKNYPHEKIKYSVGSIMEEFPLDLKFDKIVASNVFNFISDIKKALKGLRAILKKEGQLGFISPFYFTPHESLRTMQNSTEFGEYMKCYERFYPGWSTPKNGEDKTQMIKSLLTEVGFKVSFMEIVHFDLPVTLDVLASFTISLNPCQIPEEMKNNFETEVKKILVELHGLDLNQVNEGKGFIFSTDMMAVVADKI